MGILNGRVINHSDIGLCADIYSQGDDLKICLAYSKAVTDNHFGAYVKDESPDWGEPLRIISAIYKSRSRQVIGYEVKGMGRFDREIAIQMAEAGELDNVILTHRGTTKYLKSKQVPDSKKSLAGQSQASGENLTQINLD